MFVSARQNLPYLTTGGVKSYGKVGGYVSGANNANIRLLQIVG